MTTATYISTDYFRDYFIKYIAEAGYSIDDFTTKDIDSRCDAAWESFSLARLNGATLTVGIEEAIATLVDGVGTPETILVSDILLDNFEQILGEDDRRISALAWSRGLIANIPDLFEGVPQARIGLSLSAAGNSRYLIIGRIAQYLDENGLQ